MSRDANAYSGTYFPSDPSDSSNVHPSRQKLKASTKTFAIVIMVLGIVGLVSSIITPIMALVLPEILKSIPNQDEQFERASEQLQNTLNPLGLVMLSVSFVVSIAMIYGGIGTLRRSLVGVQCLRITAGIMAPLTLIQSGFGLYNLIANKGTMLKNFEDQMNQSGGQELPPGMESFAEIMFYFQIGITAVIALVFAALYLWAFLHLSKASTLAQFETPPEASGRV